MEQGVFRQLLFLSLAIVAAVSRDHFIELTNYTPELDTNSMSSVTLAPELLRADP